MTPYVQEFIQENIDLVETKKYKNVFSLWYDNADRNMVDYVENFWREFIYVIDIIDPDVLLETTGMRVDLMTEIIHNIFVGQVPELHDGLYISRDVVLDILLPTHLGLDTKTLIGIMNAESKLFDLRKVPDGYAL